MTNEHDRASEEFENLIGSVDPKSAEGAGQRSMDATNDTSADIPIPQLTTTPAADDTTDEISITILPPPASSVPSAPQPTLLASVSAMGAGLGTIVDQTARQINKMVMVTAAEVSDAIATSTFETSRSLIQTMQTTAEVGKMVNSSVTQTSRLAAETATAVGEIVSTTVAQTSQVAIELATWLGETAAKQTYQWLEQTTQTAGQAVDFVGSNPLVQRLSGFLNLDWLVGIASQVDLDRAATTVKTLQRQYPTESPRQIAHRLMVEKAIYAGGMGFVSSLLPGEAAALFAVDLAATTALQTEMLYQIAAAYGLDLRNAARKGEVLGIFGLALGGRPALKAGLGLLRGIPMAGAVIGASTNATMLYSLGYAACRFYEAKAQASTAQPTLAALDTLEAESDAYLELAIAQQAIMDQVLVHMIVASHPEKTWETILPNLAALQLSPASLKAIAGSIQSPQPMEALLSQLNRDFAIPLLAQCYRISQLNTDHNAAEYQLLTAIATKFDIDLNSIKQQVEP